MKNENSGWTGCLALFLAAVLTLSLGLAAQKDFNQAEKETIEKYKRARVHFLKGGEYLKKGKLDKAQKEADASLEIFPGYAEARLLQAELAYQRGQYEAALKEIATAKSDFHTFSKLYTFSYQEYLDRLREERDQQESYINDMAAALSAAKTAEDRARVESQLSQAKQALVTLDNRLRNPIPPTLDVPAEFHYIHGNILFKLKRFAEARDQYRAAVTADPRHANAWNNLIGIHLGSGDRAGALALLTEAEASGVVLNEKLKKAVLGEK